MANLIVLRGVVSHIELRRGVNDNTRVYISFDDEAYPETRRYFERAAQDGLRYSFSDRAFWCGIPTYAKGELFEEFVGHRVVVSVMTKRYKFKSMASHNAGELIEGNSFIIENIERIKQTPKK